MRNIGTIFKKELKDTLRDRRTLFFMVVMPFLVVYLMINISVKIGSSQEKKAREKVFKVGVILNGNQPALYENLKNNGTFEFSTDLAPDGVKGSIQEGTFDFVLVFTEGFDRNVAGGDTGKLRLYYKTSQENEIGKRRLKNIINDYRDKILGTRLSDKSLESEYIRPVEVIDHDVSSMRQKIGEYAGGYLPYIFVIFCFLGAMYPAIDLAAGEKERGTIETLLVSPARRGEIVLGKFLIVTLAGFLTAVMTIVWLFVALRQTREIPQDILTGLLRMVEPKVVIMLLALLLPLCVFFAAILLSASVFAKSFKEAQSIITPLNFMVLIPVFIGILPGIKLNTVTALIPILNLSLASKEIIAGTLKWGLLVEVFLVLFFLAAVGLYFCTQWFKRESVVFRGT